MASHSTSSASTIGSYINGEFITQAAPSMVSINPAHPDEVLAEVVVSGESDAVAAIESAQSALGAWRGLSGPARAEFLNRWADQIQLRAAELGLAVAREVGKPIGEAKGEVGRCVAILRYFAGDAVRETGQVIPGLAAGSLQYSLRTPLGVVGLITPWNFPVAIPLWKAAPALACGNTVVLKPAETSVWCAAILAETAQAAGLPAGVLNVLLGDGPTLGSVLLSHKLVRGISFTGSSKVGALVAESCAKRNAKFQTEMGGKNAAIVLPDADLKQAAVLVAGGAMRFAGQKCTATSRVIVHKDIVHEFTSELIGAIEQLKVTDPLEADCAVGPVITEASKCRIEQAISEFGSPAYSGSAPSVGYFVPPTLFVDVDPKSRLAQEELFGPVLGFSVADSLDQAIEIANDIEFGLSASLFTKDIASAWKYINRIEAGLVRVNADTTGVDPHAPFGGVKGSSSGTREQGPAAKDFYSEIKTVQINPS